MPQTGCEAFAAWPTRISDALPMAVTHVILYPDDWDGLDDATRIEYSEGAAEHGIGLRIAYPATTNRNQLLTVSNGDFTAIAAPFCFGSVPCNRLHWEHNLRELLDMDDPCFPNPFRDDPGSIRSLSRVTVPNQPARGLSRRGRVRHCKLGEAAATLIAPTTKAHGRREVQCS